MSNENWQERTLLLMGEEKISKLQKAHVLVAGLGGVGAYAAEMLVRAGIGSITIVDSDVVNPSNLNRQLLALNNTLGQPKAKLMEERLLNINPSLHVQVHAVFLKDQTTIDILAQSYDYVVDAIDTLSPKIYLIHQALENNLPLVSSMGAGGKFDPSLVRVADFLQTYNCPLARLLRKRLPKRTAKPKFKAVFSPELPAEGSFIEVEGEQNKKTTVGTISYMPAVFGCHCASVVIRELTGIPIEEQKRPKGICI